MTVSSEVSKSGPYTGNGVTVDFAYGFRILNASHLRVIRTEGGVETVLTTGFSVSGVGVVSGGNVTFSVAPTSAQQITILRDVPNTQEIDLVNQGAFFAEVVEEGFDLSTMRAQQLQEQIDRSVKIPASSDASTLDGLIEDIIRLRDSATQIDIVAGISTNVTTVAGIAANVTTVATNVADITNFSDVYLGPKTANPTLRNDSTALQTGDLYFNTVAGQMRVYDGAAWVAASSAINGTTRRQSFTATAGQTVFTVTGGYDAGFADVYLNGVKLVNGTDVTVTSGTDVVLAVGATAGDSVDVVAYGAFELANHYTIAQADGAFARKDQNLSDLTSLTTARTTLLGASYVFGNIVRLTSGTAATYTPTPGTRVIEVEVIGGGGGGGGADGQGAGTAGAAGGGGSGGVVSMLITTVAASYTYTIGAGGAGGVGLAGADGGTGGNTTFAGGAVSITASGGLGGGGRTAGSGNGLRGSGGAGGAATGGDTNLVGAKGGTAYATGGNQVGVGDGASITPYGTGGGGAGVSGSTGGAVGAAGNGFGAGGGGAAVVAETTNYAGGAGAGGAILIREYF